MTRVYPAVAATTSSALRKAQKLLNLSDSQMCELLSCGDRRLREFKDGEKTVPAYFDKILAVAWMIRNRHMDRNGLAEAIGLPESARDG